MADMLNSLIDDCLIDDNRCDLIRSKVYWLLCCDFAQRNNFKCKCLLEVSVKQLCAIEASLTVAQDSQL